MSLPTASPFLSRRLSLAALASSVVSGCAAWQSRDDAAVIQALDSELLASSMLEAQAQERVDEPLAEHKDTSSESLSTGASSGEFRLIDAAPFAVPLAQHIRFPGKRPTRYLTARRSGRKAIAAASQGAASMLRSAVRVESKQLASIRFSWLVPQLIQAADIADRDADDTPVRIVLAFDGDKSKFSARDSMLSELSRALTGEDMPYATLMYVWCNQRTAETVVDNPRTRRIRKLVVESGAQNLGKWRSYERNIRADFVRIFGEEPGALTGIGIMTDTDNTRSRALAWYGAIQLG